MERSNWRERVLLGYNHQRLSENSSSSSETSSRDSDVDFRGVFGGTPPRREMRYSFSGAEVASLDMVWYSSPWSGLSESPVFGEQTANRRRHAGDGFFDDIFRGGETYSSPRRSDRDPFCSSPGSRILSAARPLPTRGEHFGTSLPAQISLRARLTKAMGLPAFASGNHNQYKYKDGTSNGISSPYTPNASVSRFSSEAIQGQDELRNHFKPSYRQSPLSHVFSLRSKESSYMTKSEKTKLGGNLKEDPKSMESPSSSSQFNVSVNKWSCRGVPLLMPFRLRNGSKSKEKGKFKRCSSFNGRIGNDANNVSFKMDAENETKGSTKDGVETCQVVKEAVLKKPELKSLDTMPCTVENVLGCTPLRDKTEPYSLSQIGLSEETEKKISVVAQEARKPESKSLWTLLQDEIDGQDDEEITRKTEGKENVVKITKPPHSNVSSTKNLKKRDSKKSNPNKSEVDKGGVKGSPIINSGDNLGRSGLKGKVKEFVKIFNQEASSKPTPIQSSRCKGSSIYEANVNASTVDKKMQFPNVDENVELSEKQHSHIKSKFHNSIDNSSSQKNASSFSESFPHGSNVTLGTIEDPLQEDYLIKELSHDQDKLPQTSEDYVPIQVSDAKIQQWSNGKKGNIRSLLSTLQYVLWAESGWKPMPLVDIIEGSAVKRAYQKALLCLHPDKLQQKGVASHQKYLAEKVFDILQEAWEHFNSLGWL